MTTDIPTYMADSPPGYSDAAMSLSKRMHLAPSNRQVPGQDWDEVTEETSNVPVYQNDAPVGYKEDIVYDTLFKGPRN